MDAKQVLKALKSINEDAGMDPDAQSVEGWFGEDFWNKHCKAMESITEAGPELEKTKDDIKKIHDQLSKLKVTIHKEHQAGKSQSLLDGLKKQWQDLQNKIVQLWKAYDSKHGTKYAQAYA